jgi:hypothetical protein
MARCPAGHESQASDYCDTCGLVIGGEASGSASVSAASGAPATTLAPTVVSAPAGGSGGARCPVCQAERNGRFCEECGYDFDLAEAMPQVMVTPGIGPASPEPVAAPDPLARTLVEPSPEAEAEPAPEPSAEAEAEPEAENGEGGLDLEAELARAEAEAAARVAGASTSAPSSEAEAEAPATVEPEPTMVLEAEPERAQPIFPVRSPSFSGELVLVVDADRGYYDAQVERGDIVESEFPYPKYPHERRFTFTEGPVRIGRASSTRGLAPEIDLTGPPLDPAVSHLHAQLLRHKEGWVVVDLDSANGTRLNDGAEPLEAETEIPVKPGDRIHLGVWTTITVQ